MEYSLLEEKLTCPKCRMPFFYGWESLGLCASFLIAGWTYPGRDGRKRFAWIKCAGCKHKIKIIGLRLEK